VKDVGVCNEFSKVRRRRWNLAFHSVLLALLIVGVVPRPAAAEGVKGQVNAVVENGFARFVFVLQEEVEAQVRLANNIVTITFNKPVDIAVDRLSSNSGG